MARTHGVFHSCFLQGPPPKHSAGEFFPAARAPAAGFVGCRRIAVTGERSRSPLEWTIPHNARFQGEIPWVRRSSPSSRRWARDQKIHPSASGLWAAAWRSLMPPQRPSPSFRAAASAARLGGSGDANQSRPLVVAHVRTTAPLHPNSRPLARSGCRCSLRPPNPYCL